MNEESKFWSIASVCITAGFIAFCVAAKGCNDSDNILRAKMVERGCTYLGDNKLICGHLAPTSQDGDK